MLEKPSLPPDAGKWRHLITLLRFSDAVSSSYHIVTNYFWTWIRKEVGGCGQHGIWEGAVEDHHRKLQTGQLAPYLNPGPPKYEIGMYSHGFEGNSSSVLACSSKGIRQRSSVCWTQGLQFHEHTLWKKTKVKRGGLGWGAMTCYHQAGLCWERQRERDRQNCDRLSAENIAGRK